jgi:hypothetical protein
MVLLNYAMNMLLKSSHLADYILDNLGRQLLEDFVFGSSQNKGRNPLLQAFQGIDIVLGLLQLLRQLLYVRCQILIILLIEN